MPSKEMYEFIKTVVGLDVAPIGEETICRVVNFRMSEIGCKNVPAYLGILRGSSKEKQNLIDDITISETWFFRDSQPFQLLSEYVVNMWQPAYFGQKLNILSIPCSTGEEPYSIAMALSDAGLSEDSYVIDAVDVNTRVLKIAKNGVYGENSFRSSDTSFRDKYFRVEEGRYKIVEPIKAAVSFYHQNILSPNFMEDRGPYDIVFCRNLLIYFDLKTKCAVLKKIAQLMSPDGLLFLGHAETGRVAPELFESLRRPCTFAYKRTNSSTAKTDEHSFSKVIPFLRKDRNMPVQRPANSAVSYITNSPSASRMAIGDIQELADKGQLDKAKKACDKYLASNPESVDGYYLLGIIKTALGDDDGARDSFKRSIYLDPNHYQSLVHLAILCEEQGDVQAAEIYRARSGRAEISQKNE